MTERQKAIREMCNASPLATITLASGEIIYAWGCDGLAAGLATNRQMEQLYDGETPND